MLLVANWKMNGNKACIDNFCSLKPKGHTVVICPPFTHIAYACEKLSVNIGAQDCHFETEGAFTSSISAKQLKDIGSQYVILGHSERHEEENIVHQKIKTALKFNLIPIVCIGETLLNHKQSKTLDVLEIKKEKILQDIKDEIIWAYEPLWAIGTGLVPTREDVLEVSSLFKNMLYGGSVNSKTAPIFQKDVQGFLIGGASLLLPDFQSIIDSLE